MPHMWTEGVGVYAIGSWPAPFGIVLVVDRLAALMLVLTSMVGLAALVYSLAYWDRVAPAFHSLFQFLLMGLNGAFLTGDLFNLFVFFEVLLASSYGLLLHGSGVEARESELALRRGEPRGLVPVPDRRRDDLRYDGHAEHGGSRRPHRCSSHRKIARSSRRVRPSSASPF